MSISQTFTVTGMTCIHCARSVEAEVGNLVGVETVKVDISARRLDVTADQFLDTNDIRIAVEAAGYNLAE